METFFSKKYRYPFKSLRQVWKDKRFISGGWTRPNATLFTDTFDMSTVQDHVLQLTRGEIVFHYKWVVPNVGFCVFGPMIFMGFFILSLIMGAVAIILMVISLFCLWIGTTKKEIKLHEMLKQTKKERGDGQWKVVPENEWLGFVLSLGKTIKL